VVLLEVVVVIVGIGAELQLLHLDHVLLLLGVMLFLLLLVLVVAEIHGLGDRRNSRGSDQNQIESQFLRLAQGGRCGHDLGGAVREDGADFTRTDRLVHVLSAILPARRKVSAWIHCWLCVWWRRVEVTWIQAGCPGNSLVENRNGVRIKQAK